MDDNDLNKKQKLEHELTEANLEGGINSSIWKPANISAVNDNINLSNASTVDVCNSRERKSCPCTKTTLQADQYGFYHWMLFLVGNVPCK